MSKGSREKGMWELQVGSWRVMPDYQFRECLVRRANSQGIRETLYLEDFLIVTFLPFTHAMYTLITH